MVEESLKSVHELGEALRDVVLTSRVHIFHLIGGLPLMDVVLNLWAVHVVIVHSSTNLSISDLESSWQASLIDEINTLLLEEVANFLSIRIVLGEDEWFLLSLIVALIADGPDIVEGI